VNIEITHGQLAQAAIDRFPIAAAGEIRFRHCAPVLANFENGDNMIGVLLGFQIEDQRWKAKHSERSRSKNSALEARRRAIAQNLLRRSRSKAEIVRQIVEKFLNTSRR